MYGLVIWSHDRAYVGPVGLTCKWVRRTWFFLSHRYIPAHLQNQLNLGENTNDLFLCMCLCQNHNYCQTAVFDQLKMHCTLFEECSTVGRIVSQI